MIILFSGLIIGINDSQFQVAFGGSVAIQCPAPSQPFDGFPSSNHIVGHEGEPFCLHPVPPPCDTNNGFILMPVADGNNPPVDRCVLFDLNSPVIGGKIIPVDSISLLLAGVQVNYSILTALAIVGVGAGFGFLFFGNKLDF